MTTSRSTHSRASGFTIVELLVVIVVIAILAAITIVAYRGISQRAIVASLSSDLDNASKQLKLAQINTGTFPTANDCSITPAPNTICLKASTNTTYQYTVNNSTTPPTFCLTVTNGSTSYFTTNDATPTAGGCPGHGVGGSSPITNLATNPSAEAGLTGWANRTGSSLSLTTTNPIFGSTSVVVTGAASVTSLTAITSTNNTRIPVTANNSYAAQVNVEGLDVPSSYWLTIDWYAGSTFIISTPVSSSALIPAGTIVKPTVSGTAPATATAMQVYIGISVPSPSTVMNNRWELDGVMVTQGSAFYTYADPITNPTSWVWNGTPNASTSTGPAL